MVKEKISISEYIVEDVLDGNTFTVKISGKQRLYYFDFAIDEEIYFVCSPYQPDKCRLVTSTDFKMDDTNSMWSKKLEIDKKQKEKKF